MHDVRCLSSAGSRVAQLRGTDGQLGTSEPYPYSCSYRCRGTGFGTTRHDVSGAGSAAGQKVEGTQGARPERR